MNGSTIEGGDRKQRGAPRASNEVRLSWRGWVCAGVVSAAVLGALPALWRRAEPFRPGADYRMPYELSSDYWLFDRYCRLARRRNKTLCLGDSVVWGHYVPPAQTLSHHLSRLAGGERFANLGVDGIHPAALAGLLEHYGRGISAGRVLLHCNPLWMASPAHDLQRPEREFRFNHPRLIPQFFPAVPSYRAGCSERLAICAERLAPFAAWTRHLQIAYLQDTDLPAWTVAHPYGNPAAALAAGLPPPADRPRHRAVSWQDRGITEQALPWVELETSLQWRCFRRAVEILQERDNAVFVVVGPFNEHLLTRPSLQAYRRMTGQIQAWLREQGIPYHVPAVLPSRLYADASHPLGDGYAALARQLFQSAAFVRFSAEAGGGEEKP